MKVAFFLNHPQDEVTSIMLSVYINSKQIKSSTGIMIPSDAWKQDIQKATTKYNAFKERKFKDSMQLNAELSKLKSALEDYSRQKPAISAQDIKDFMAYVRNPEKKTIRYTNEFADCITNYLSEADCIGKYTKNAKNVFNTLKKHIMEYGYLRSNPVALGEIDFEFYQSFLFFLTSKQNLMNSTAYGLMKRLKTVMRWASQKGLIEAKDLSLFKSPSKDSENVIALNEAELDAIEQLDLEFNSKLDKARNIFLLQCYTGMRYSDIANLKPENIKENEIVIFQIKTTQAVTVPMHTRLRRLLDKYPDLCFPTLSNQKTNDYIKVVAAKAEINTPIQIVKYYGKERKESIVPKHELVCTHTARRTFITLTLQKGILPEMVMKVSGHKSRSSFDKYVKIAKKEAVEEVRKAWD